MKNFFTFLNSGAGLVILGFLVTTGGGSILNYLIQTGNSDNERKFEMYKTRLEEAKSLQKVLLEHSTTRLFYLQQILLMLADRHQKPEDTKKFWNEKYANVKDDWNKNLVYWQAQLRVLFKDNLDELLQSNEENINIISDVTRDKYIKNPPKTVHLAFVYVHRTFRHMVFECQEKDNCNEWDELLKLADEQMKRLEFLHRCLSYRISGELLVDPYGPHKKFVIPAECNLE